MAEVTGEEYRHDGRLDRACKICKTRDRDLIESLCAAGAYMGDVAAEFGFLEREIRRHEAMHSTKQPNVDPLAMLRHLRWLAELSDSMARDLHASRPQLTEKQVRMREKSIDLSLKVAKQIMDLTGAQKYMDPHVMLPRWTNMMGKLLDAFKNNPEAIEILLQFMESEGPKGTVVATKAQRLLENGKEIAIDYGGKESGCDEIPPEVEYSNNWNGQARRQWRSNNAKRGAAHLKEYWKKKKMDEHLAKQAAAATQAARQESAQTPQDTPNE